MKLDEGITYNKQTGKFLYDFKGDTGECIIKFNATPELIPVQIGINDVYYFGYTFELSEYASSEIRTKFFNDLRYSQAGITKDKHTFIINALKKLHNTIDLYSFDTIVYPQSRSILNKHIIKILQQTTNVHDLVYIELLKQLPSNIEFDWDGFKSYLYTYQNKEGKFIYQDIPHLYKQMIVNANNLLERIKKADYFSIAETIKKNKYKTFIEPFLYIQDNDLKNIKSAENILIIDDVATTGATLLTSIKAIRKINTTCKIVLFSIVGTDFTQKL